MDFIGASSEYRSRKIHFWSEIGSGFGESGGTAPPRIPISNPPGFLYDFPPLRGRLDLRQAIQGFKTTIFGLRLFHLLGK